MKSVGSSPTYLIETLVVTGLVRTWTLLDIIYPQQLVVLVGSTAETEGTDSKLRVWCTCERFQIIIRAPPLVGHHLVKLRDDAFLLGGWNFSYSRSAGSVNRQSHSSSLAGIRILAQPCSDFVAAVGRAFAGPQLVFARGNILPTTAGEGRVLHGVS